MPKILQALEQIQADYQKFEKVQKNYLAALIKGKEIPAAVKTNYSKILTDITENMQSIRLNPLRIEDLIEQITDVNQKLMMMERNT